MCLVKPFGCLHVIKRRKLKYLKSKEGDLVLGCNGNQESMSFDVGLGFEAAWTGNTPLVLFHVCLVSHAYAYSDAFSILLVLENSNVDLICDV